MNREELIKKINKQAGFVDVLDAFRICDVYTDLYGVQYFDTQKEPMDIEDQLILMWEKIKDYDKLINNSNWVNKQEVTKPCHKCHVIKPLNDYHKCRKHEDGHKIDCKVCAIKQQQEWVKKKLLKDPDYHKKNRLKYKY
jgi:hypothetical protein